MVTLNGLSVQPAATPPVVPGRVSAIVPSFGRQEAVLRCITSLAASDPLPPGGLEIVIVSSGYKQDLLDALRAAARPGVTVNLVVLAKQRLVSWHRNLGAAESSGEWLLFIDDDNEVAPDTVECLRVALSDWVDAAMVAPVMYYRAEPTWIWCAGGRRTAILARTRMRTELPRPKPERLASVDFPNCFMVRADEFAVIGGFDDEWFPVAYEEADLAARLVIHRGGTAFCVTAAAVWHDIEITAARRYHLTSATNAYQFARNRQLYLDRHGSPLQRVASQWIGRWLFLAAYLFAVRTAPKGRRRSLAAAHFRGFREGRQLGKSVARGGPSGRGRGPIPSTQRSPTVIMSTRCPADGPGGVEAVVRGLSAGLNTVRPNWEIRVATAFRRPSLASRIPVVGDLVAGARICMKALRGWDLFLVNGSEYAWGPLLIGKLRRRPVVVVWHGVRYFEAQAYVSADWKLSLLYKAFFSLERRIQHLALRANATVAVGPTVADELRSVYGFTDTVHVIPNGVTPPPRPAAEPRRAAARRPPSESSIGGNGGLRVLWVGARKQPYGKGLDVAVEACALARQAGTDLMLDVVGFGGTPREFTAYGEKTWITWHGRLSPQQTAERYAQADVLLFPTRYEPCSMVVLEALASGLPVVGSLVVAWLVADAGVVVGNWEPSAYAAALTALWRSPPFRAELSRKAVARASCFTWEIVSTSYAELLEAVMGDADLRIRCRRQSVSHHDPSEA